VLKPAGVAASTASDSGLEFNTGSLVEKAKMEQSPPTKVLVGRMLHETVEVAHYD
jgi:hypothetical protein